MVRKVLITEINELKKDVKGLRLGSDNLINVTNAEWYSLFNDEIRNSIAIEGVFANRQELLDVLENNKRANKQKRAAILGYYEAASAMYEYANNQLKENEFILIAKIHKEAEEVKKKYGLKFKRDIAFS